jgi:predicted nucleotidyltransferase
MGILEILSRARLEPERSFLVIGGYAVNAHGYSRQTMDLDLLIPKDQQHFWKQLVLESGYVVHGSKESFLQFVPVEQEQLPVDFMLVNEPTFSGMYAEAMTASLGGVEVKIPSLRHLIALKLHVLKQGLPHRELRDLYDVFQLVNLNKIDVRSDDFKKLCERYGNSKLYETILRGTK